MDTLLGKCSPSYPQSEPGAEEARGSCPPSWASVGAEAPKTLGPFSLPGSTVPSEEKGVVGLGKGDMSSPRKGPSGPLPKVREQARAEGDQTRLAPQGYYF